MERLGTRVTAVAGAAFVVLSVAGIALIGSEPSLRADPSQLTAYLHDHANAVLTTNALLSLANGALIVFVATLQTTLPSYGRAICLVAVTLLCAIGASTAAIPAALAHYGTAGLGPQQVHALVSIYFAGNAFSALPAALLLGTVAVAATRDLGRPRLGFLSGLVATIQLAMTFSLLGHGSLAPDSHLTTGAIFGLLTLWVAAISITATRGTRWP